MKALTISQPYASLIASGEKWVENREWQWPTTYRGPLAIHAGKGRQYLSARALRDYPIGCVLGVAELVGCVLLVGASKGDTPDSHREMIRATQPQEILRLEAQGISLRQILAHEHTQGPWCLILKNIRRYCEPIPCQGKQGLWDWEEPELAEIVIPIEAARRTEQSGDGPPTAA